jgi:hypothetical protein
MLRQHPVDVKNFFEKSCAHEQPSSNFDGITEGDYPSAYGIEGVTLELR